MPGRSVVLLGCHRSSYVQRVREVKVEENSFDRYWYMGLRGKGKEVA